MVDTDSPLTLLNNVFFKRICQLLDHREGVYDYLCFSPSSTTRALANIYEEKKKFVSLAALGNARSRINISFDMWTSPNCKAYLAVVAHFLDRSYQLQNILLSIHRHTGVHEGEKIASSITKVLDDWGISSRLGVTISDNASSNNTCVDALYRQLRPELFQHERRFFRIRCYGHILNLIAKAFLFGADDEAFLSELEARDFSEDLSTEEINVLDRWRRNGPVGKLHSIVRFIRASPQRRELLKTIGSMQNDAADDNVLSQWAEEYAKDAELGLVANNQTRWNSTYLMIERAIRKRPQIDHFLAFSESSPQYDSVPSRWHLTTDDWMLLTEIKDILEPVYLQTKRCEGKGIHGHYGSIWEVLGSMKYLLGHFEKVKEEYADAVDDISRAHEVLGAIPARRRNRAPSYNPSHLPVHVRRHYDSFDQYLDIQPRRHNAEALIEDHRVYLSVSINLAWKKLDDYYTHLDESPFYASALLLHPKYHIKWFYRHWSTEALLPYIQKTKDALTSYYTKFYVEPAAREARSTQPTLPAHQPRTPPRELGQFESFMQDGSDDSDEDPSPLIETAHNELSRYLLLKRQKKADDPIEWWRANEAAYPYLSKLALDIFSIPAMATETERTFSLAKLIMTAQRQRLSDDTLNKLLCMKHWLRRNVMPVSGMVSVPQSSSPASCDWEDSSLGGHEVDGSTE